METNTARTIGEVVAVLGLIIFSGMELTEDKAYGCEASGLAMNCDKLSAYYDLPNGKCYNSEYSNKLCRSGWELIKDQIIEPEEIPQKTTDIIETTANGKNWICNTNNGKVEEYTKCYSDEDTEGYLGELLHKP